MSCMILAAVGSSWGFACRVRSDVPSAGANLGCLKDTAVTLQLFPALFILMQSRHLENTHCAGV